MNAGHLQLLFLLLLSLLSFAERVLQPAFLTKNSAHFPFTYKITGFFKAESYTDTRQTTAAPEENLVSLYPYFPLDSEPDPAGNDINAHGQTQFDLFDTRVRVDFSECRFKNALLTGAIESNLFAITLLVPNIFIMRHAYINIDWPLSEQSTFYETGSDHTHSATLGFTFHPIAFPIPNNLNYNGLFPYDFFSRAPQCTYTYHFRKKVDCIVSATSQVIFQSNGPQGYLNTYAQNAIVPNFHFQVRVKHDTYTAGASIDYTRITPRIETNTGFNTHEELSSVVGTAYIMIDRTDFYLHTKCVVGQDPVQYGSMGGYAVKKGSINPITDHRSYTNLRVVGFWSEIAAAQTKKFQPGLFLGVQKSLGSSHEIELDLVDEQGNVIDDRIFGFATEVNISFRVAPRLVVKIGKIRCGVEVEYTQANYGTINNKGKVVNTHPINNVRTLFATYYYF